MDIKEVEVPPGSVLPLVQHTISCYLNAIGDTVYRWRDGFYLLIVFVFFCALLIDHHTYCTFSLPSPIRFA